MLSILQGASEVDSGSVALGWAPRFCVNNRLASDARGEAARGKEARMQTGLIV